ncbi:MAG: hypothetical protein PWQ55_1713 [Chloroflexota bacterium]|nr:hypothetical protein [Chloroflexota bacterium]
MTEQKTPLLFLVALLTLTFLAGCNSANSTADEITANPKVETIIATESIDRDGNTKGEADISEINPDTEDMQTSTNEVEDSTMNLQIGDEIFTATLVENSSTAALKELLAEGPISINMQDYGNMEKVGGIGTNLPTNDEQITTEPGDLILYQGSAFVIYYAPNSWNFTRLGKIDNITQEELRAVLGSGNVTVTLSLD